MKMVAIIASLLSSSTAVAATAPLVFDSQRIDLGSVAQGEELRASFGIENRGAALITLDQPIVACDCRASIAGPSDIPAGGRGQIDVVCDTSHTHGHLVRSITVVSSAIDQRATVLHLQAEVALEAVAEPNAAYLGKVVRGSQHQGVFSVRRKNRRGAISATTEGVVLLTTMSSASSVGVRIRDDAPLGPFTQTVEVRTGNARFPLLRVEVAGRVVEFLPPSRW